ncbi:MAG TPA: SDR family NAD(P)-dependent oxidoreductase [Candidatus Xenobia bacterium]|jgi:NAD(P)-dependent dehydrogenase (short-subunit alcohol dehydrogenase family)
MKILITGATSGHGRYLAERLAPEHDVLVHGRDRERTQQLAGQIGARPYVADLSSLGQVRRLAAEISAVDALINNAGIGYGKARELSADGHELRLAVMYLAPVLLSRLVKVTTTVLNVGSLGQAPIDFDDLQMEKAYDGLIAYRRAKLALAMATFDMAAERPDLRVNVIHPATYMDTNMVRGGGGTPQNTVQHGGDNTLRVLETSMTGTFFNEDKPSEAHPDAYRMDLRARLREATDPMLR